MGDMVMMNMSVGENIRTIRKERGLTQKALAEKTGLSVRSIQDFEYDKIVPKLETLLKLASVLQVSPKKINSAVQWDEYIDTANLAEKVKHLEDNPVQLDVLTAISNEFGEGVASTFENFLFLSPDGKQKASEYIELLMQKYKEK